MEGIAESTASLAKLGGGFLSDRVGRRKVLLVWGYALASVVRPLLVDSVPPERKGTAFGLHRAAYHAGSVLGPLLAACLLFLAPGNLRLVFALAVIPGVITVLVLVRGVREIAPKPIPAMGHQARDEGLTDSPDEVPLRPPFPCFGDSSI